MACNTDLCLSKQDVREILVDYILKLVIEHSDEVADWGEGLESRRRIVSTSGENIGQLTTGTASDLQDIFIYHEDFQEIDEFFKVAINSLTSCYRNADCEDIGTDCLYNEPLELSSILMWSPGFYDVDINPLELAGVTFSIDCEGTPAGLAITNDVLNILSQFIPFSIEKTEIDPEKAKQILDTNIYELIPPSVTRQERINIFFREFEVLKGDIPNFNIDVDDDGIYDTWAIDVDGNQLSWHDAYGISELNIDGDIVRLDTHAAGTINEGQTLQSLRDSINVHLTDIDKDIYANIFEQRPEYENKSDGYMKIRGLNQGVIIRKEGGDDVGLIGDDEDNPIWLTDGFTITTWVKFLDKTKYGTLFNFGNPFREVDPYGFALETFTLHADSLMNSEDPFIMCNDENDPDLCASTFGVDVMDQISKTWRNYILLNTEGNGGWNSFDSEHTFFLKSDYERFIRLVVYDHINDIMYDSHVGTSKAREGIIQKRMVLGDPSYGDGYMDAIPSADNIRPYGHSHWPVKLMMHQRVPLDFQEWYFIVANFNPDIQEVTMHEHSCSGDGQTCAPNGITSLKYFSDYWKWHVNYGASGCDGIQPTAEQAIDNTNLVFPNSMCGVEVPYYNIGSYTHNSGHGAKCKVELISKSNLLRARGFKPSES